MSTDTIARGLAAGATNKTTALARRSVTIVGSRAILFDTAVGANIVTNNYTHGESHYTFATGASGIRNFRLVMANWAMGPYEENIATANDITVEAAVTVAGDPTQQVARATFGGKLQGVINPGANMISDPVGIFIPSGTQFVIRTGVYVTAGQSWPTGYINSVGTDNATASAVATSRLMQQSSGLTIPAGGLGNQYGYAPIALLGETDTPEVTVAIIGDSLTTGGTGAGSGNNLGDFGVLGYGLADVGGGRRVPYIKLARASEAAQNLIYYQRSRHRYWLANYSSHVIVWLGTNDVSGKTAATVEGYLSTIYTRLRGRGQRVIAVTLPPRTTGTFATTGGQTPMAGWEVGGVRDQVNTWIKGQVGGLIDEVIDLNPVWESATTPGVWVPNLSSDGTHPNETGMQAGKGTIATAAAAWTFR